MSLKTQAVSGVKWTSVSAVVVSVLQILQLTILTRLLSPHDFGLVAIAMVIIGFAQVFVDMGISNAIIYRQDTTHEQLSSLYWLNVIAGIAVFGLMVICIPLFVRFYNEPRLSGLIFWAALSFIVMPFAQQFQILLQKELLFNRLAKVEIVGAVFGASIAILAAILRQGSYSLVWGWLTTVMVRSLLLIGLGWREWRPSFHFARVDLKGYTSFGLYQMGERSINYFATNLDKLLIGRLLGTTSLGYYSVAYQLMLRPMSLLNPMITKVVFPLLSKIQHDNTRLNRGYLQMTEVISFMSMPVYLGMLAVARPLMHLLLGSGWDPSVTVFQILAFLGILYSLGNPIGSLLLAKGRADIGFWMNIYGLAVYVIAIWTGSHWGINGVAWALLLSTTLARLPVDFWVRWYLTRMRPFDFIKSFAPFLSLSALMAITVVGVASLIRIENDMIALGALALLGGSLYAASVLLIKRTFVKDIVTMVLRGR
ncbi:MAG: MOP flippase family protein [Candidatus Aquicultor sp.]